MRSWPIDRRGAQPVADHVAHDQRHPAVGALERVVPVAADRGSLAGRQVARGDLEPLDARQALGQQAALERLGDRVLALVDLAQLRPPSVLRSWMSIAVPT